MSLTKESNDIFKDYHITRNELGSGNFGKVFEGIHIKTKKTVAIKVIPIGSIKKTDTAETHDRLKREINIHAKLNHPNIVKCFAWYNNKIGYYIVMESVEFGDLFSFYQKNRQIMSTIVIKKIIAQIISAVGFCHGHLIGHRDLKLENILISSVEIEEDNNSKEYIKEIEVKVCDFGLANYVEVNNFNDTQCGSYAYVAAEVLSEDHYNPLGADVWSIGVIIYALHVGCFPWRCTEDLLITKIMEYDFDKTNLPEEPEGLEKLLDSILCPIEKRITLDEFVHDPYIRGHFTSFRFAPLKSQKRIDCDIIEKIEELGFNGDRVMSDVRKGRSTIGNHIYHTMVREYSQSLKDGRFHMIESRNAGVRSDTDLRSKLNGTSSRDHDCPNSDSERTKRLNGNGNKKEATMSNWVSSKFRKGMRNLPNLRGHNGGHSDSEQSAPTSDASGTESRSPKVVRIQAKTLTKSPLVGNLKELRGKVMPTINTSVIPPGEDPSLSPTDEIKPPSSDDEHGKSLPSQESASDDEHGIKPRRGYKGKRRAHKGRSPQRSVSGDEIENSNIRKNKRGNNSPLPKSASDTEQPEQTSIRGRQRGRKSRRPSIVNFYHSDGLK